MSQFCRWCSRRGATEMCIDSYKFAIEEFQVFTNQIKPYCLKCATLQSHLIKLEEVEEDE